MCVSVGRFTASLRASQFSIPWRNVEPRLYNVHPIVVVTHTHTHSHSLDLVASIGAWSSEVVNFRFA